MNYSLMTAPPMTRQEMSVKAKVMKSIRPETTVPACKKVVTGKLPAGLIPAKYIEELEHNQKINSCCRHPENHEIEALYSNPNETVPDIYIFHCACGRQHRRFCCGGGDQRPFWDIR